MLVMIKAILYERTVAVCASMDFGKGLGRSEPTGDGMEFHRSMGKTATPHSRRIRNAQCQ